MTTKAEVTAYIDSTWSEAWTSDEESKIDAMLNPEIADILIKVVGEVEFLKEVAGNKSN
jgi:hypothetical protein